MENNNMFSPAFSYKLIYIFRINDQEHMGKLKIGEATVHTEKNNTQLLPNCEELNLAAKNRINDYTSTAGIRYELLHTELAVTNNNESFKDTDVHEVLLRSGYEKYYFETERKQNEWFVVNLDVAKNAIKAVKDGRTSLTTSEKKNKLDPIILRPEQEEAVTKTIKQFAKSDSMLWNAKMRFGKTISALELTKRQKYKKTIIITHRPVVDAGWYKDFNLVFNDTNYLYGSKKKGEKLENLLKKENPFIYFASMQDLRGAETVGGKFKKDELVFNTNWDFVIIDEAHEGTKTEKGVTTLEGVIKIDNNYTTKILKLSGTAFNLLEEFDDNEIYTWDYIMEQEAKKNWDLTHKGDPNPYIDLPELNIYTYDLNKLIPGYEAAYDTAFNFKEFFRVWTGDVSKDGEELINQNNINEFVHKEHVKKFLDLMCTHDNKTNYPFSRDSYREYFRHSLWMVPGVKEARALSKMLQEHPVFGSGQFKIINIAGDGDEEVYYKDALQAVNDGIGKHPEETYTITLSCGKLTTGVTVKPWTAVFMLSGSNSTQASSYLQTIFRVQSPANIGGKIKEKCYVFDFAPDRSLKMIAQATKLSIKAGDTSSRKVLGKFLNFCPVISINGSRMVPYNVDTMMGQLKKAYAERVVSNGFDDRYIYNDNLYKLDDKALELFEKLQKIVGTSKAEPKTKKIDINSQGFTEEEYEIIKEIEKKKKKELTEEEKRLREELLKKKKEAGTAISILRGISIRIPLLIYGANISDSEDITVENLPKIVDDESWEEFMPKGVTKEMFKDFSKYYEHDIFIEAGRKIRRSAKYADTLPPTERVVEIANIFSSFRNPDKETVLTPWKTVNMHLGDTIGGYNFYDKINKDGEYTFISLEDPKYISHGEITQNVLNNRASKVLEINSKSGLYPLYITYSIYKQRCLDYDEKKLTEEILENLWNETLQDNIFVLCKTPMAKTITERTLKGYKNINTNIKYDKDLFDKIDDVKTANKINSCKYWNLGGVNMNFEAIVGNPPYQNSTGGGQAQGTPLYNKFVEVAMKMDPQYISMIMPSRWFAGGFSVLDTFRKNFVNGNHIVAMHDFPNALDCFSNVSIKGGVCYFLYSPNYSGKCEFNTHKGAEIVSKESRYLLEDGCETIIRNNAAISILHKIKSYKEKSFSKYIGKLWPFITVSNFQTFRHEKKNEDDVYAYVMKDTGWIEKKELKKNLDLINKWKLYVPRNVGTGNPKTDVLKPIIGGPNTCCSGTYIVCGPFSSEKECKSVESYINTKFFHFLLSLKKISIEITERCFEFIPIQDFSSGELFTDEKLFKKYNLTDDEIILINDTVRDDIGKNKRSS